MKTLDYIHLDAVAAGKVVEALQQLLADYQVFYTNLRGFHWNIKGHGFFVLHSKFEDMYNDAAEKVDELAERILMLGGVPVNKFSEYLKVAKVKEVSYLVQTKRWKMFWTLTASLLPKNVNYFLWLPNPETRRQ